MNLEVGEICGNGRLYHEGFCFGSVNTREIESCDSIFSEGSKPLKITSQTTQTFIAQNFEKLRIAYVSEYLIGLQSEYLNNSSNHVFRWWDGTPMTFQNFMPTTFVYFDVLTGVREQCVSVESNSALTWQVTDCWNLYNEHQATICQRGKAKCTIYIFFIKSCWHYDYKTKVLTIIS